VSSKKKNQHFVPRHYLRRFCFDDGNRIRILRVPNGDYIGEAGLKGQSARPYFYHTDPDVEEILSEFEGRAEELFKRIVGDLWLPADAPTQHDILTALNVMRSRTERFAEQTFKPVETAALEFARIYAANKKQEFLRYLPFLRVSGTNWPMHRFVSGVTSAVLLGDLHLKLLIPPQGIRFLTSDHPVVFLNQAFANIVRGGGVSGLAMRGLQIFLPLSPVLLLLAFDPVCYRVGRPDHKVIQIYRKADVELINALQVLNANQCLYFRDEEDRSWFRETLTKFRNRRPALEDLVETRKVFEGGQEGVQIKTIAPDVPLPGVWSFCKKRHQFIAGDFRQRDPERVRLYAEYDADCRKRKQLLRFEEWLAEKEAKANFLGHPF
jgi:Protein of unknown function (DUF4238)